MSLPQLPPDKANHLAYGAAAFCATFAAASLAALPALPIAAAVVAVVAVGKEFYDRVHPTTHTADPMDAAATLAGGLLCALPLIISR